MRLGKKVLALMVLGIVLFIVAIGRLGGILLRLGRFLAGWLQRLANDAQLSELAYRYIAFGFAIDPLVLILGVSLQARQAFKLSTPGVV